MFSFIKRHKVAFIGAVAVLVIVVFVINRNGNGNYKTVPVSRGEFVRTVELAGKVVPLEDVDLAFEVSGTVARAPYKVGDRVSAGEVVVELDQAGTRADLLKAEADLAGALAELGRLSGTTDVQTKVDNSKTTITQNILDAYTDADDAIYNKIDQFFEDARTANPKIVFSFDDYALRNKVNDGRVRIGLLLADWKKRVSTLSLVNYTEADLEQAKSILRDISLFLDDVARAVNSFKPSPSITQTLIDKYKTDTATARQNINAAAATLITGQETYSATVSDVSIQNAKVASARANVANYQARLGKMVLRSPIAGVIAKQEATVGESASANITLVSIISDGYMIEAYVPEVSIAGVVVGARAKVTLDAYGDEVVFDAEIAHIDPRETIKDGVSTYKIDLVFTGADARIRSGMTSNISIETLRKANAVYVPQRSVQSVDSTKKVFIPLPDGGVEERTIMTGELDSKGNIEVVSGLQGGEQVFLDPK